MIDWLIANAPQIGIALGAAMLHVAALLFAAMGGHLQGSFKGKGLDSDAGAILVIAAALTATGWLLGLVT